MSAVSLCTVCALVCVLCCFLSVGSDGRAPAMTAALVFSIFLLVLALCGTVWSLEAARADDQQHHQAVAKTAHAKLMRCWIALCVCAFVIMLCCAIFVGDWNANGPDASRGGSNQPDHVTGSGASAVGFYKWTQAEKFVCANCQ